MSTFDGIDELTRLAREIRRLASKHACMKLARSSMNVVAFNSKSASGV